MPDRPVHRLSIEVERERDVARVVVDGDLDRYSASELRDVGMDLVEACSHFSVDVVAASVIDSSALGVLIELQRAAGVRGCVFQVIIGPSFQHTLFTTTGLADYFDLVHTP